MGKISKWILNSLAVGAIQAQDFEVTNCEDANVSLIRKSQVIWDKYFQGNPAVSVRITEQYFNANFNAHQNDFTLNNGNYEATFTRDVLDMVHDDANDGEQKSQHLISSRVF